MQVDLKLTGLDGVLATLRALPPEIVSKRGGPVRVALRKGALVVHAQAKANLQARIDAQGDDGQKLSTGLLLKNLVVTRGKAPTGGRGERYLVRVRRKTYERKGQPTTTLKTAQIMEYGSQKQAAQPWLVPAFKATAARAIGTVQAELLRAIDRAVKRLAQQNKGRG
jgi:hypothetical protein